MKRESMKTPIYKKWWFWLILIIIIYLLFNLPVKPCDCPMGTMYVDLLKSCGTC